jgi:sugar phosphate isomerase/epimerase
MPSIKWSTLKKLSVVAAALNSDLRTAAREARSQDFRGIQLNARTNELDLTTLSVSGQREVRQVIRSFDLEIDSLLIDLGQKGLGPTADVDAVLAKLDGVMQAARGLQTPLVCVEIGPLPAPVEEAKPAPAMDSFSAGLIIIPEKSQSGALTTTPGTVSRPFDSNFAASVDAALAEIGRAADRYGVMLAFRSDLAGFAALDRALRQAACSWFGVDLDPVAMLGDQWSADEIFSRLGGMIRHVRGRDAVAGADHRTKPVVIGTGSVNWESMLSLLDDAGFSGWIAIDPLDLRDRKAAAIAGAGFLRKFE